ncbi:MAG: endonuclease/exonuclease/phosphatase family protein, partial [Planctomycetota bacterium]|nr:endonuclease/exonuclease/phosphatase family protein [Planctomycetota bacterium]
GVEEESKTSSHQKSSMGVTEETGTTAVATMPSKRDGEIKVGTFNIRNFGKSQLSDPGVAATLAHIAMGFDVIAIQEISHKNGNALEALVAKMNLEEVGRFDYLVSTLLGKDPKRKGTDTEQFGFIYDKSRIELTDKNLGFVVSEKRFKTKFDRLPVVSSFKVKNELAKKPFTFTLVSFHNVPAGNRRWEEEVANLPSVYQEVRRLLAEEDDIVLLGDFNADSETILRGLAPLNQNFASAVPIEKTNVIQTKSYDNLVFDIQSTSEFIEGRVFNFSEVCKLYGADPRKVSDHFPVYATFAMEESDRGKRVASAVERELAPR